MKFVIIAIASANAAMVQRACWEQPAPAPAQDCQAAGGDGDVNFCNQQQLKLKQLQGAQANLPQSQWSNIGVLTRSAAGSTTEIGASNVIIPDKKSVTDQAKVVENNWKGKGTEQTCSVAANHFNVAGKIELKTIDTTQLKSSGSGSKSGEDQGQVKQKQYTGCGEATTDIPCTTACEISGAAYQAPQAPAARPAWGCTRGW